MSRITLLALITLIFASSCSQGYAQPMDTQRRIEMTCGGTKVSIDCGYNQNASKIDDRICNNNILRFALPDKKNINPMVPESHDPGSTPIAFFCEKGSDNDYYISVDYLSGNYCCAKCHALEIFNLNGERLSSKTFPGKIVLEKSLSAKTGFNIEGAGSCHQ